jgi:hypothetical protein
MRSIFLWHTAFVLSLTIALPSVAATVSYSSDLTGQPFFDSPEEGNPPTTTVGLDNIFPYQSQPFFVDITGSYSFLSTPTGYTTPPLTQPAPPNWNNFTILYQNNFNPATPLINAIIANNNFPTAGTSGFNNINLTASTQYFFVTSVFNPDDGYGTFTNSITGPGTATLGTAPPPVTAVPFEFNPALGLIILGGWGAIAQLKERSKKQVKSEK